MRNKVFIIAEAGVNHNGDYQTARKLVEVAAEAGVDAVKFQTFKANQIVSQTAKKAQYQVSNLNDGDDLQYSMLKKLEMPEEWHSQLIEYAKSLGILFLSTAFDEVSIDLLNSHGIELFKIPSGEITNLPYLQKVGKLKKNVILSTGMSDMSEIKDALNILTDMGTLRRNITVLHCHTEYPTAMKDVNLRAMQSIGECFKVRVGYSDHTCGIEIPIAAVSLGATIIEKHFTLDKSMIGPDHLASLEPIELISMVRAIRNVELALGSGIKEPTSVEIKNRDAMRKSIHVNKNLKSGHKLKREDLIMKRPGNGISPMLMEKIVGGTLVKDITKEEKLNWAQFK